MSVTKALSSMAQVPLCAKKMGNMIIHILRVIVRFIHSTCTAQLATAHADVTEFNGIFHSGNMQGIWQTGQW